MDALDEIANMWEEPIFREEKKSLEPVNLVGDNDNTLIAEYCRQISKLIQFPLSTVYAHCLGCIASAMNRSFYVKMREESKSVNPVNIYIVGSQPPSTGKSGVNDYLSDPVEVAYYQLNKQNAPERALLIKKIKNLQKEIASDEKSGNTPDEEILDKVNTVTELTDKLDKIPSYQAFFTNATPEALESHSMKQRGMFNIVSDESGSILSSLGITYGDTGKLSNADMVLQGWDMNRLGTIRVGRDASFGRPRGVFAVLAQDETVEAILSQGDRGVGVAERFLICRENDLLGQRDHMRTYSVDDTLMARYSSLIHNLVFQDDLTLKLSPDALLFIKTKKQEIEPDLGEHGKYSSNVMRGVLGKMDKQVCKIASIIHAAENFEHRCLLDEIQISSVKKAYNVYMELTKVYINTSDEKGFNGVHSQVEAVIGYFQRCIEKGKSKVNTRTIISSIKNSKPWKGQPKQTSHFAANVMPILVSQNICRYGKGSDILINPLLS